jgi:hypothetical protein
VLPAAAMQRGGRDKSLSSCFLLEEELGKKSSRLDGSTKNNNNGTRQVQNWERLEKSILVIILAIGIPLLTPAGTRSLSEILAGNPKLSPLVHTVFLLHIHGII